MCSSAFNYQRDQLLRELRNCSTCGSRLYVPKWFRKWYHFGVANLSVKDLPDSVYSDLKEAARAEGRSLNGYIVALLKTVSEERNRRKLMRKSRGEYHAFLASLPHMGDSTALIREDREGGH